MVSPKCRGYRQIRLSLNRIDRLLRKDNFVESLATVDAVAAGERDRSYTPPPTGSDRQFGRLGVRPLQGTRIWL
jgi:hypothetical protein